MSNYSQQLASAIAAMTKNTIGGSPIVSAISAGRPRSVSEILDVRNTFVAGFPQHIENTKRVDSDKS